MAGTFSALRLPEFRILWISAVVSFLAFFMSTVVQSVVAFELTGTNRAVGSVVAAQGLAMLVLGPLGGALADRVRKRRLIAAAQAVTAGVFLLLALALATHTIRVEFLALGSLVMGATFAFIGPARQALTVDLVPAESRGNALALTQVGHSASRVLGPAFAGLFLGWTFAGATGGYLAMATFYVGSAAALLLLPRSVVRAGARDAHILADIAAGLRYVRAHRRLRLMLLFFVSVIMFGYPYVTVIPGLLEHALGRDAHDVGTLFGVSAAGALAASLGVARFADSRHALRIYTGMGVLFGASLVAVALAPSYVPALVAMIGVGAGSGGFQSLNAAVIVRETEPAFFGRVSSLSTLAFAGFGLMGLPIGLLADAIGERVALAAMGVGVCAIALALAARLRGAGAR
ncbi:MAG: MFS transporter [Myxococcota bacterium]